MSKIVREIGKPAMKTDQLFFINCHNEVCKISASIGLLMGRGLINVKSTNSWFIHVW